MAFTKLEPAGVNTSATFTFSNVSIDGNLTVSQNANLGAVGNLTITGGSANYVLSTDGSGALSWVEQTGGGSSYANANVANYLPTFTGELTAGNIDVTGNITAAYYIGDGSLLTSVATAVNVTANAQPNITSVGSLSSVSVTGLTTATGGVKTANIIDTSGTTTIQTRYNSNSGDVGITGNLTVGAGGSGNIATTGLTVTSTTNLGAVGNIRITGGLTNQVLTTDGLGNLSWSTGGGGGSSGGAGFITVTKDTFTATGSANTYTLSITPSSVAYVVVNIDGIVQQVSSYSLTDDELTILGMPESGEIIEVTSYGVGGLPGGDDTEVQFNDGGIFQGAPTFTFNSATGTVAATNFTGNITTGAQPNITSVGDLASLNTGNFTATGWTTLQESTDVLTTKTGATGTVTHDVSTGAIFYHSSIAGNFTANFTNVSTTDNRSIVFTLILAQGATPYYATACQVDGVSQTIKWPSATAPTATASRTEFQNFVFLRVGSAWVVTSSLASFG